MSNKSDNFKMFIKANTFLISYVRDKKKTWQELYELYDIVGDDEEAWNKYLEKGNTSSNTSNGFKIEDFIKIAKNIDVDKVQEGITSLQKTLSLFGDLFTSNNTNSSTYNPRPLYRRFDD